VTVFVTPPTVATGVTVATPVLVILKVAPEVVAVRFAIEAVACTLVLAVLVVEVVPWSVAAL
jgi:hypothetical protein